jgi:predicted nucleic acid-binding protein
MKLHVDDGITFLLDPIPSSTLKILKDRYPMLKNGELEVISWGIHFQDDGNDFFCVIDEKVARDIVQRKGLGLIGTKGLISLLQTEAIIDDKTQKALIDKLISNNPRMR